MTEKNTGTPIPVYDYGDQEAAYDRLVEGGQVNPDDARRQLGIIAAGTERLPSVADVQRAAAREYYGREFFQMNWSDLSPVQQAINEAGIQAAQSNLRINSKQ